MKKRIVVVTAFICAIVLVSCTQDFPDILRSSDVLAKESTNAILYDNFSAAGTFDITVSYANWIESTEIFATALNADKLSISSVQHLPIYKFSTPDDVEQFKLTFGEQLTAGCGYDDIPSFHDEISKYDNDFFEKKFLLLIYIGTNSGAYRFGVDSMFFDASSVCIHIKQTNCPDELTDDMAGWFITIAIPDSMIANCTNFDADLNNSAN